jgi:branched-chain amino acid transport system permease protein
MNWLNAAVQGILLGGLYGLFAVGLSLVFGTMRLTNLAHGDLTIFPAYVALMLVNAFRFNPLYSIPITMAVMFLFGYLLQRGVLNHIVIRGNINAGVIVTFGISMVLQNVLLLAFTANSQGLDAGKIESLTIKFNDKLSIGWLPLLIFILSVVAIAGLQMFQSYTKMGRAFRAVSDNQDAARLMGINVKHTWAVAMGVSLLLAAVGGIMMGVRTTYEPMTGIMRLLFAFEAVIIGGMGSIWGTLLGGIIIGLAQTLGAKAFGAAWSIVVGHVVFIVILALRPQGFLAKTVTT